MSVFLDGKGHDKDPSIGDLGELDLEHKHLILLYKFFSKFGNCYSSKSCNDWNT